LDRKSGFIRNEIVSSEREIVKKNTYIGFFLAVIEQEENKLV
jgi:hypothetical protein